ncbi:hypothetical protein KsCSTR_19650 [Candidatus Kuenenia stuttgartiensis]|uniref:Uncharacterized protein n=1 Tax=Kuenenia stuttgartiensis TaxID=174633 RepID=Q1Q2J7_KUEST|nr:hypothetical protein KsCSTR_19650 [Candidatus Kuenenia stuttgartiensis]CAJ74244.1 unknown protein [Candidatus Kuenenia stuttgartiensis]
MTKYILNQTETRGFSLIEYISLLRDEADFSASIYNFHRLYHLFCNCKILR